ncbi:glucose dehydrogenase [FAD, quinone]-like [Chrysoperla carnea]|uniref:glucose dehydrogenase [FAD, quinone]-like n=1 Tax=Chrysoperla carnea TaxID=189513 RepID=UPI001D094C2A|nr:glucose dehydrogenase [FAD, quinone]-like [Chrysoperla carnea]
MSTIYQLIYVVFVVNLCVITHVIGYNNEFKQYPETSELKSEYDFIVVGAGSAGCVLANRLSEIADWSVLLIEAGGPETFNMDVPALAGLNQHTSFDWSYYAEPSNHFGLGLENQTMYFPRGKVMGGSSVTNFMIYTRGNPKDYDQWNITGWSYIDVEKYFLKLENYNVPDPDNEFGNDGPMYINVVPYHSNLSNHILKAAQEYGLPLINTNGPKQVGVSRLQSTIKNGVRFSTNTGYLTPIRNSRPNLHLIRNCQVTKVLVDNFADSNPKASGVQFVCSDGKISTIFTRKEVILSAGAINSPQILMLSGIGPKNHLTELDIPLIKDLPVGDNMMDHINMFGLQFLVNQTVFPKSDFDLYETERSGPLSTPAAVEVISFSQQVGSEIPSIEQLFISSPPGKLVCENFNLKQDIYEEIYKPVETLPGFLVFSLLQHPKSRGWLRLRDSNPFSKPKIFPNYLSHPEDIDMLILGIKEAINISKQPSLQQYGTTLYNKPITQCKNYEFGSDDYWKCQIRTTTFTLYHQCGTCKMGEIGDPTAVVDSELKVQGVLGLRVVDASVMPEIITGHPNGPVIMIAEKAADLIKKDWNRT